MIRPKLLSLIPLIFAAGSLAAGSVRADMREEPVGLILTAAGGKVLRANTETPLAARSGDILFSGDRSRPSVPRRISFIARQNPPKRWIPAAKFSSMPNS